MTRYYNCSEVPNAKYDLWDPLAKQFTNPSPKCAQLYRPTGLPYAFHFYPLKDKHDGFPFVFDINLSQDRANRWLDYLQQVS